jgi:hypothetical protein
MFFCFWQVYCCIGRLYYIKFFRFEHIVNDRLYAEVLMYYVILSQINTFIPEFENIK